MTYSPTIAVDCARASLEAYDDAPFVEGYETIAIFSVGNTQAFICTNDYRSIVAYRGTELALSDWLSDLKYIKTDWHTGRVHKGFKEAFGPSHDVIVANIPKNKPYFVAGHSLGGALATLEASFGNASAAYVFGCPRVANNDFKLHIPLYRHEKALDAVTYAPPRQSLLQTFHALIHWRTPTLYTHHGEKIHVPGNLHSMDGYLVGVLNSTQA